MSPRPSACAGAAWQAIAFAYSSSPPGDAQTQLHGIEAALADVKNPRLLHGFGAAAWAFIELAARRGYDTRVGLEDTLVLPDGTRARDNAELVAMAWRILDQQKP